jgi:germination protein M
VRQGKLLRSWVMVLFLSVFLVVLPGCQPNAAPTPPQPQPALEPQVEEETMTLKLHFVFNGKDLVVTREVPATRAVGRAAIQELIKGHVGADGEHRVLPPGTQLKDLKILDGIAYADFSREFRDNHWGGLISEVDTIYSVVNTLGEFPTVRAVQFLLEGSPLSTIGAGAVDLREPVKPQALTPEFCASIKAQLYDQSGETLPWSVWVKGEERLAVRDGFPETVLTGDCDGDGAAEIVMVDDKRVSIWDRKTSGGGWEKVWERKFHSFPDVTLAPTRGAGKEDVIVATADGIHIFGFNDGSYTQLGWQGVAGHILDLAAGDTTGDGRAEVMVLFGAPESAVSETNTGRIVIWELNGETYRRRQEEEFPFRRILLADFNGDQREELLALDERGLTVFGWKGSAYIELGNNPGAGSPLATMLTADLTGDGAHELIIRDDASAALYVYTWQESALRKLWQGPATEESVLGREVFAVQLEEGPVVLLAAVNVPGRYLVYSDRDGHWREQILAGASGEQILALGDVDGDGVAEIIFRRHQLLSNPTQWLYVGKLGSLPQPPPQEIETAQDKLQQVKGHEYAGQCRREAEQCVILN